jgi:hypothetical protein
MNAPRSRLATTLTALVAVALCLLIAGFFLLQERFGPVLVAALDRLGIAAWAGLVLLAALSSGTRLLRLLGLKPATHSAAALFGLGTGLLLVSTALLLIGAAGYLGKIRVVIVLMALVAAGTWDLGIYLRAVALEAPKLRRLSAFRAALWLVIGLFFLLNLTRSFAPPTPYGTHDYDDLEYHLAAPAQYHAAERVFFIRDNVYANFPQASEMLCLAGMELTDSPTRGAAVGRMLNALLGLLAALALTALLRGVVNKETADAGAAIFYTWPGVTLYSGLAHVEPMLIFFATLALWALLWSWRRKLTPPGPRGWAQLAAVAAGGAMSVKYTGVLLVFAPTLAGCVLLGFCQRLRTVEIARRVALFAGVAVLVMAPWLVRNALNTGNPVYPLLDPLFHSPNWSAAKDARWMQEHSPRDTSAALLPEKALEVLTFDQRNASLALILFLPLCLLAGRRTRWVAALLAAHCAALFLLYFYFTQHNERFIESGVTALAALSALGLGAALARPEGRFLRAALIALLLLCPSRWMNYQYAAASIPAAVAPVPVEALFDDAAPPAMKFINDPANLSSTARVLFLGEARTFHCRREFVASTVFDTNALEELLRAATTPEEIRNGLTRLGVTHLYVDTFELARLQRSYAHSFQGRDRLGMLDGFNWPLFADFARRHLKVVWSQPPSGVETFPWERWPELLQLADKERPGMRAVYEIK